MDTALCGLGQTAPNPVLSTMKYFWDEYEAHVLEKRCPAGVCQKLLCYEIIPEKCVGCTACARGCPVSCISGTVKQLHVIDQSQVHQVRRVHGEVQVQGDHAALSQGYFEGERPW